MQMADQQIDRLTVGVGLTNDEFRTGIDEVIESINGMRQSTEEAAEGMGASFASLTSDVAGLALKFGGLFLAIRGIEDVVGYFKDLSSELAELSFAGEYLGQSSVALSRWGEVARLAGGNAEDAVTAVRSLQSAIFGLEFNGQMSQNLLMLNRLRVAYTDQNGKMLPLDQIAMNAAKALEQQLPGKAMEPMRVSWAAQIFGPGGLANAVGGGVTELRKFYAESSKDQKGITQRLIDSQRSLQQDITRLSYEVKSEASGILNQLTPEIKKLIGVIRDRLIPTIDEAITDFEEWLHPGKMVDDIMSGKKDLGSINPLTHPINFFEAMGIGLGIRAGQFHEWWEKNLKNFRADKLANIRVPGQVTARIASDTNLEALKLLHIEAGGDAGDPTWSKAVTAYSGLREMPGGVQGYVNSAMATGNTVPQMPKAPPAVVTPHAARPASHTHPASGTAPTASLGPRVAIGTVMVNAPQAKDANGIAAAMDRALQRKLLAAQADPGLA